MTDNLYMVYDNVANRVHPSIIIMKSDAPAIRAFNDALATKDGPFHAHATDFDLLLIGTIDDQGAILASPPERIATGAQWAASKGN